MKASNSASPSQIKQGILQNITPFLCPNKHSIDKIKQQPFKWVPQIKNFNA